MCFFITTYRQYSCGHEVPELRHPRVDQHLVVGWPPFQCNACRGIHTANGNGNGATSEPSSSEEEEEERGGALPARRWQRLPECMIPVWPPRTLSVHNAGRFCGCHGGLFPLGREVGRLNAGERDMAVPSVAASDILDANTARGWTGPKWVLAQLGESSYYRQAVGRERGGSDERKEASSHSCPTTDLVIYSRFGETVNPLAVDRKGQRRLEGAPVASTSKFKNFPAYPS
ncbi:predicted protein [Postia placenta Mad-698-R]|nr:predicted protein [Postia placenta Mad-698-R]